MALHPRKQPPIPNWWVDKWSQSQCGCCKKERNLLLVPGILVPWSSSPQPSYHTEWVILAPGAVQWSIQWNPTNELEIPALTNLKFIFNKWAHTVSSMNPEVHLSVFTNSVPISQKTHCASIKKSNCTGSHSLFCECYKTHKYILCGKGTQFFNF